jgi:hypothetical protein
MALSLRTSRLRTHVRAFTPSARAAATPILADWSRLRFARFSCFCQPSPAIEWRARSQPAPSSGANPLVSASTASLNITSCVPSSRMSGLASLVVPGHGQSRGAPRSAPLPEHVSNHVLRSGTSFSSDFGALPGSALCRLRARIRA